MYKLQGCTTGWVLPKGTHLQLRCTPLPSHHWSIDSKMERASKFSMSMTPQQVEASVISRPGGTTSPSVWVLSQCVQDMAHCQRGKTWGSRITLNGTCVSIAVEGKRHLGAALSTSSFVKSYVRHKVSGWVHKLEHLSSIAATQPHAAYVAFTHSLNSKWTYLARTIPDNEDQFWQRQYR